MVEGLKKVLVIGSGPIIIGQAAEFDYAGTQACRALKEEGLEVVLINPATIMTDEDIAPRVYVEPIPLDDVTEVIEKERPDGLLATLGGQVGLNMAVQLANAGVLEKYNVQLLGTRLSAIEEAEDRELFKKAMNDINQPVPESDIFEDVPSAIEFADKIGYPIIVRPAFTLGGTGGGIAHDEDELFMIATRGIKLSPINQILVERSVAGWKEIEYEVMRDKADNCIIVCNMENVDPVGIHTGDSIVVAPSQTLNDLQYQMLRTASLDIIRRLKIEGGCNVQYALDPNSNQYYVIEVNPRVSRSSALASKATGYPIAKVAAKVATGLTLDQITNAVTGKTTACFEPTLDYCVVKFPRWPFEKFALADKSLGTQMKATGEVMSLDRCFEGALLKAVRSLEIGVNYISMKKLESKSLIDIVELLQKQDDERLFVVAQALRLGISEEKIHYITGYDLWFLHKIKNIIDVEFDLQRNNLTIDNVRLAKRYSMPDAVIAEFTKKTEEEVRQFRVDHGIMPTFKMVDTCAAEFEAATPYYYSCYATEDEVKPLGKKSVIVLGSGPIRIGLGESLKDMGIHSGLMPAKKHVAAKAPVFSFSKIGLAEIALGPEMKSTGEVMGIGHSYSEALYKAVNGAKMKIPAGGTILVTVADRDKAEALHLAEGFKELGYHIIATEGTGSYFNDHGMPVDIVRKIHEGGQNIATMIRNGKIDLVLNTLTYGKHPERDGFNLRRMAVELAVPCLTSLDTAREVLRVFANKGKNDGYHHVAALQDYDME